MHTCTKAEEGAAVDLLITRRIFEWGRLTKKKIKKKRAVSLLALFNVIKARRSESRLAESAPS